MTNKSRSIFILLTLICSSTSAATIDVGDRLEPIVDDYLIDRLDGAALRLHRPTPREVALKLDKPWEGKFSAYFTVLKDGDKYRMYYRGTHEARRVPNKPHCEFTCMAESDDGIRWTRPKLKLYKALDEKENNVILARHKACHNFAPFIDTRPGVPAEQRYKALGGQSTFEDPNDCGMYAFTSPDGVHWKQWGDKPVIARDKGDQRNAFDSQSVAFWSESEGCYVCYYRIWEEKHLWIARTTSKDFMHWTRSETMDRDGKPLERLYTTYFTPYVRASHVYLALPMRFMPRRWALNPEQVAELGTPHQYAADCTDVVLLSSRGDNEMKRTFQEAFIRPGLDPYCWTARAIYAAYGIHQTGPAELSIYVYQHCGYPTAHVRRYTLRPDGFVSVGAPYAGGEMVTKPIRFTGNRLSINYSTSAAGVINVEIQGADGRPIPGFTLGECRRIIGDHLERIVSWKNGSDVSMLAEKPIRLRVVLKDADLYAFRFSEE